MVFLFEDKVSKPDIQFDKFWYFIGLHFTMFYQKNMLLLFSDLTSTIEKRQNTK